MEKGLVNHMKSPFATHKITRKSQSLEDLGSARRARERKAREDALAEEVSGSKKRELWPLIRQINGIIHCITGYFNGILNS